MSNRSGPNILFRNDGGHFANVAKEVGLDNPMRTVGSCWFDMDKDGDLDVFVSNQDGDTNSLYRNDGGHFVDVAPAQHLDRPGRTRLQGSVGCTVGDFDNDGNFDIFVAEYGVSALYHNDGHGVFTDVAAAQGVAVDGHMVAASWADYDNDGLLDLYVAGYVGMGATASSSDRLFRNAGGRFVNLLSTGHPLNASDHGVQWADYDGDGDLDLALTEGYPTAGRDPLLRNELSAARRRNAFQVAVVDAQGHATRAGAEVRLFDKTGKILGSRLVSTGDGYDAQSVIPAHFGLAKPGHVNIEVTFLTSHGRVTKRIAGVDTVRFTGRALTVKGPL